MYFKWTIIEDIYLYQNRGLMQRLKGKLIDQLTQQSKAGFVNNI